MNHQHLIRLASTGKKPRDVLSSGHVAKVFPHSGNYNGLGRGYSGRVFLWVKQNAD